MSDSVKKYVFGRQIRGGRRGQEDRFDVQIIKQPSGSSALLFVMADGMGGYAGGALASSTAIERFVERFKKFDLEINELLKTSLYHANQGISIEKKDNIQYANMGCTLVAVYIDGDNLYWISVGDSMLYLYRRNNELLRLNEDHSMVPVLKGMVDIGRMTAQEAASDSRRNQLRSAVSGEEIGIIDLPEKAFKLVEDDYILLASDGLHSISEKDVEVIIRRGESDSMECLTERLIVAVKDKAISNQDNTSLILYQHHYPQSVSLSITESESASTIIIRADK